MKENNLGIVISKLRKEKGLTQKDLADKLNISDKAVSRWETGNSSPDMDMIFRISKFFNINYLDLLAARAQDGDDSDDNSDVVENIIKEFSEMNKKNSKRIKIVLIAALIISVIFIIAIIFTHTFNRFKVYTVHIENANFNKIEGVYVETRIKDTLHLGNIKIKGYEIKETDTISVDLYFIKDNKEYILQSYSSLNNIHFVNYQSYIEIDDLSDYANDLYIKITIIDYKNNQKEFIGKLNFILDFSNNKIFYNETPNLLNTKSIKFSADEIKEILLENGFEEINYNILIKKNKEYSTTYIKSTNKIIISFENNKLSYRYTYLLNNSILEVVVFDKNNIEIENYKYDVSNDKVTECKTGSCNNYKQALKIINENILNLLYKS